MRARPTRYMALLTVLICLVGCTTNKSGLRYPQFDPRQHEALILDCKSLDASLRRVDSIRWSMREDGVELETSFEHLVQLSVASAGAIAIAVPMVAVGVPDPTLMALPYAVAYTSADNLKLADALLIAFLSRREDLQCPPHPECVIDDGPDNTLAQLRTVRKRVEAGDLGEQDGLDAVSSLLDALCPVGDRFNVVTAQPTATSASDLEE